MCQFVTWDAKLPANYICFLIATVQPFPLTSYQLANARAFHTWVQWQFVILTIVEIKLLVLGRICKIPFALARRLRVTIDLF